MEQWREVLRARDSKDKFRVPLVALSHPRDFLQSTEVQTLPHALGIWRP